MKQGDLLFFGESAGLTKFSGKVAVIMSTLDEWDNCEHRFLRILVDGIQWYVTEAALEGCTRISNEAR